MRSFLPALPLLLVLACNTGPTDPDKDPEIDARADLVDCPGRAGCAATDDTTLRVGAAVKSIIPACYESWVDADGNHTYRVGTDTFLDCGCDRLCPGDEGYTAADEGEGDGVFHPVWIAGYDSARAAMGMRGADQGLVGEFEGLDARAVVIDQGNTRVAIVTLDGMGWMNDDVERMREAVNARGLDVDHVLVSSSHSHDSPDSMGQYGRVLTETGYDPDYAVQVHIAVADAVQEAIAGLKDVTMKYGEVNSNEYFENGVSNIVSDTRDPQIVDPRVGVVQFVAGTDTVATLIHFANHPESMGDETNVMSAGFLVGARHTVESGSKWLDGTGQPGVGGVALYINGSVGGMMTSLHATVIDPTGVSRRDNNYEKEDAVGQIIGELALDALASAKTVEAPKLRVLARRIFLPVDNIGFQAMFSLGVFGHRPAYSHATGEALPPNTSLGDANPADVRTEIDLLELGPVRMITAPGEMLPEGVIGGYQNEWTPPGGMLIDPANPNPPDVATAPAGPYFLESLGGDMNWLIGLGNDEVGYMVPPYNFELGGAAYLSEAEGHHYEETNSLGPQTLPIWLTKAGELVDYAEGK